MESLLKWYLINMAPSLTSADEPIDSESKTKEQEESENDMDYIEYE